MGNKELVTWLEKEKGNEPMPNIKITAEVNGKKVPLENISTETFEAIKALEKPKEIPVVRLADYCGSPRLLLMVTDSIRERINHYRDITLLVIDPNNGNAANYYQNGDGPASGLYNNIRSL